MQDSGRNGQAIPGLPVVPGSVIGIVANPMSGRDIRRLVAQASVFPNAEKTNMALRLIAAAGATGVDRVLMSTDAMGVAAGVLRARDRRRADAGRWPRLDFVELDPITGTAEDTRTLVRAMRERGADVIVLLGGDGTVRAASVASGDVALLPLSTGTNNAFPEMWEATVAGTAAGLFATGRVPADEATRRAKVLHVVAGAATEVALVDVCVSTVTHVGSKALWQPATLREVYCAFAEPHADRPVQHRRTAAPERAHRPARRAGPPCAAGRGGPHGVRADRTRRGRTDRGAGCAGAARRPSARGGARPRHRRRRRRARDRVRARDARDRHSRARRSGRPRRARRARGRRPAALLVSEMHELTEEVRR